jgi:hypothetical protein
VRLGYGLPLGSVRLAFIYQPLLLGIPPFLRGGLLVHSRLMLMPFVCVVAALAWRVFSARVPAALHHLTRHNSGFSDAVDLYNSATDTWSTAQLSVARFIGAATSVGNLAIFAGGEQPETWRGPTNAADLYNSATGTWSTAQLSVGRKHLAATTAGNLAIFAGGFTGTFSSHVDMRCGCRSVACFVRDT